MSPLPVAVLKADPWQIRYLVDMGTPGWLVHIVVVLLTGALLASQDAGFVWPFVWIGAQVALSIAMLWLCHTASARLGIDERALIRVGLAHTLLTSLVGLIWAGGALILSVGDDFSLLAIYSLALGGTALGAVSSQHAVPRSAFASIWTSVPFLGFAHIWHAQTLTMGIMVLLYGLILSVLTVRMHRFLSTNYNLATRLDSKVSELTEASAELQAAREAAEASNLSKSRFLAQASHDLRQPIHAIGLLTASLKDTRLTAEQRQILHSIDQSVDSVSNLFASLLDISRLETGGIKPEIVPLDLGAFLDRVMVQNHDIAAKAGCDLSRVSTQVWVKTDASLLFTMVQNLLGNAFKYAPRSRVLIGPRRIAGKLALQICDTGPGIAADQVEAVFSEFYRLKDRPGSHAVEGMGLGLSIVRGLCDLLELKVRLTSIPGRGTCVTIGGFEKTAPVRNVAKHAARTHPLSGMRICLIDDDENVRTATVRLLERWGCVVAAHSGDDEMTEESDAILADMQLADGRTGLDVVATLRRASGRDIPAAILTGHADAETLERIAKADLPVLNKPVPPAELRALLTRLCLGL